MVNKKTSRMILALLAYSLATGCALRAGSGGGTKSELFSANGVKYISTSITNGNDPASWLQNSYLIGSSSRLLIRLESLSDHVDTINVTPPNKVRLEITGATAGDTATAQSFARVCPITQNWMEQATWDSPFPHFGHRWSAPGGDYDASGCVSADVVDGPSLLFDMTTWFINYPRGRGENLGVILVSDTAFTVLGENSGSYSPRFLWQD